MVFGINYTSRVPEFRHLKRGLFKETNGFWSNKKEIGAIYLPK